ncbi:hypothetical protein JCM17961_33590 [Endothiovibrio diazotrophicus]
MAPHDSGYKHLFSHPELVRDLLEGFVHEAWVKELDFSTLERVAGSYVSDDLRERIDDMVWRVRLKERWVYVYLLLEFQSTIAPFMAVRLLTYLGLLYQDLIKRGRMKPRAQLPPVLPLVLYNGVPRWGAPLEIGELIEPAPGGLEAMTRPSRSSQDSRPRSAPGSASTSGEGSSNRDNLRQVALATKCSRHQQRQR